MIRPQRRRIMPRSAARARRKPAVRSTSITFCQSSSFMRSARLSRVRPALLTRMSSWPIAASAALTSASRRAGIGEIGGGDMGALAKLGGQRLERRRRVPASSTVAPCAVERARDRAADAARGAGDQGRLAAEIEHRRLLLRAS